MTIRTTADEIVANLRESRDAAREYAAKWPEFADGWNARAEECQTQLEQIEGTEEQSELYAEARRRGIDL